MTSRGGFYLALVLIGALWGLSFPLSKIAVSTGYQPLGILVWQQGVAVILTGFLVLIRGKPLVLPRRFIGLFIGVTLFGSVVPGYFSYVAAAELPAGVLSIIIALVPLFAMPIALMMGYETPSLKRLSGLIFGAAAVAVLIGPESSLPDPGKVIFIFVAILATLAYGIEGNFLEWFGRRTTGKMPDPFQILFGANIFGLCITVPLTWWFGQFIDLTESWSEPDISIVALAILSTFAYASYIWLIGHTGPIFAAQVAYLITGFGVFWSIILLNESYSGWVWLALVLMMGGLLLVQPKKRDTGL